MSLIPTDNPLPALLEFIAFWVPDLGPQHRVPAEEIPDFVPPPLRAIYELTGNYRTSLPGQRWQGLFCHQDSLVPWNMIRQQEGRLIIARENQNVWVCSTESKGDDPPVYSNVDCRHDSTRTWPVVSPRLSTFLVTMCLHELIFGSMYLSYLEDNINDLTELVHGPILEVWKNGPYGHGHYTYDFYLCQSRVLIMQCAEDSWVAHQHLDDKFLINTQLAFLGPLG